MSFVNEATKAGDALTRSQAERFVLALSPFAPHICEELWSRLGGEGSVGLCAWPEVDERFLVDEEYELVVQVHGKVRGRVRVAKGAEAAELERAAREAVAEQLEGREVLKVVVVPDRLVNFVVR
jgi:leucyl-tRNA synthetase